MAQQQDDSAASTSSDNRRNKRRISLYDDSDAPAAKLFLSSIADKSANEPDEDDDDSVTEDHHGRTSFFNLLSDEVVLEILKHVDGNTLYHLGETCIRFRGLVTDRRLWEKVDLSSEQLNVSKISKRLKNVGVDTREIKIRGNVDTYPKNTWQNLTITSSLLSSIADSCPNLHSLEIYNGFMNFEKVTIRDFPSTLRKLLFHKCMVDYANSKGFFFTRIDTHFENLQDLSLEDSNWFETHDLVIFSKLPNLKRLSLKSCHAFKDCVPYGSIATRFGFKSLEHLDIRDTPVSDSDIQCFNATHTLKELLLECPDYLRENYDGSDPRNVDQSTEPEINTSRRRFPTQNPNDSLVHFVFQNRAGACHNDADLSIRNRPNVQVILAQLNQNRVSDGAGRFVGLPQMFSPPRITGVSDRGVCSFGSPRNPVQEGVIWIRAEPRPPNTNLERIVLRHYNLVTDTSLNHLVQCSPNLVYLDLTGTSVTKEGLTRFKELKPLCYIVSDHYTG